MITLVLRTIGGGSAKEGKAAARELCTHLGLPNVHRLPHISRSGTAGLAAVAFCQSGSVGVDVECITPHVVDDALLHVVLHPLERADMPTDEVERHFFSLWTRKEAVLKAMGTGLALAPTLIAVGWSGDTWQQVTAPGNPVCIVRSWPVPAGFAGAIAIIPDPSAANPLTNWPPEVVQSDTAHRAVPRTTIAMA